MRHITGLIGREELIEKITREARKGRHLLLTGPAGIGKSTILEAVIDRLIVRRDLIVLHVNEHQAKGQFLEIARGLLESGLMKPSALELDADLDALNPAAYGYAQPHITWSTHSPALRTRVRIVYVATTSSD